jgi:inhibitor of cysteine peptidase
MNNTAIIVSVGILCLVAVAFTGCLGNTPVNTPPTVPPTMPPAVPPTLSETPVQAGNLVVTEEQNGATVSVNQSSVITVRLKENPTTGFQWNLTTTAGLKITNDSYVPSDTTGKLAGSGGTHSWDISAVAKGTQNITAIYWRSWEPLTGNETAFSMTVIVG